VQFISCHNGKLQTLETAGLKVSQTRSFTTGLEALDALAPEHSLARGAVHELLFDDHIEPKFIASVFARPMQPIVWSDPHGEFYPPALAARGFDLKNLYLLHPQSDADQSWAITEALRCPGVAAVVASPRRLSRIEARRLQLAAERGGSVGILMRPRDRNSSIYAAATRWLVSPVIGERTIQRWKIQLLHGHGGRIGQAVFLEFCRETHSLRAIETLPDRQTASPIAPKRVVA
jgi:protein ImuA